MYTKPKKNLVWIERTRFLDTETGRVIDKRKRPESVPLTFEQELLLKQITDEAAREMREREEAEGGH